MPSGQNIRKVGVYGHWYGGSNYAMSEEYEEFRSVAHAKEVMRSRIEGWDPVSETRTPLVEDSEMALHASKESDYPFALLKQTKRGIRKEST